MKKKFFIIDNNFVDYKGHHFFYNLYLYDILKKNCDLEIYVNKNFNKDIKKLFRCKINYFFENKKSINIKKKIKLLLINFFKKIPYLKFFLHKILRINFFFNKLIVKIFFTKDDSEIIKLLIEIEKKNENTSIFLHSLSTNEFLEFVNKASLFTNNHYILVYRRDPRELDFCLDYLSVVFRQKNISLLTDSHKIKHYLSDKKIPIKLINIPIFFKSIKNFQRKNSNKLNVAYFGDARLEKGFFKLPKLIDKIENMNFTFQANSNGYDLSQYNSTLNLLKKNKNIKLLLNPLSQKEYFQYLLKSDVVLLPYLSENYKYRTSAIFLEAIVANKIPVISKNTWMSTFFSSNQILKQLIINSDYDLKRILKYIILNKKNILNEIKKIKKKFNKIEKNNNLKKILLDLNKNNNTDKSKISSLNFIIDDYTITRNNDGNKWGSFFLFRSILNELSNKPLYKNLNVICNTLTQSNSNEIFIKNKFFYNISNKNNFFYTNFIYGYRYFKLNTKINKLIFKTFFDYSKLDISDYIIINFHYYKNLIAKFSIFASKKIIIFKHDQYNFLNSQKDILLDKKNLFYIFVSKYEYDQCKLNYAKKYIIYPHNFNKKIMSIKKEKKYNYYFVSSGSDIDVQNILYFLKLNKINHKIHLIGEIYLKKNYFKNYLDKINFLGYIQNISEIYSKNDSIFLVPRYFGSGIPIKFLESLKYSSKVILFGDIKKFGLPKELILPLFYKNKFKFYHEFVNSINYVNIYKKIYEFILENNIKYLKKFREEIKIS